MKKKYFISLLLAFLCFGVTFANAESKNVDCLLLEDENSIICKYTHSRQDLDKTIVMQWIEPDGRISRERDMLIPSHHGSIYDFRYIQGRTPGTWTFKVIDEDKEYITNFIIE